MEMTDDREIALRVIGMLLVAAIEAAHLADAIGLLVDAWRAVIDVVVADCCASADGCPPHLPVGVPIPADITSAAHQILETAIGSGMVTWWDAEAGDPYGLIVGYEPDLSATLVLAIVARRHCGGAVSTQPKEEEVAAHLVRLDAEVWEPVGEHLVWACWQHDLEPSEVIEWRQPVLWRDRLAVW